MGEAFICRRGGGGIAGLNFKVVGGTTQPTNPRENTIWVNTSDDITGWVFAPKAPTASEGLVWFAIGNNSPVAFNAIKKNGLWVYPGSCQQYISGAWVTKTAKTYQSNAWKDWLYWLYDTGVKKVEFQDITTTLYNTTATVTWGDDSLELYVAGSTSFTFGGAMGATKLMDVSAYKTLNAQYESISGTSPKFVISVSTSEKPTIDAQVLNGDHIASATLTETKSSAGTLSLDISQLETTEVCCCLSMYSSNRDANKSAKAVIKRFWLE